MTQEAGESKQAGKSNRQWRLKSRPVGMVKETDFEMTSEAVAEVGEGQFLVRNLFFAFEPAMRGWLNDVKSYVPPVGLGEVMRATCVGQVVESRHPDFREGQLVSGVFGWQDYTMSDGQDAILRRPVVKVPAGVPPERTLGALGSTGLTAYFGMLDIGEVKSGDAVLVSGAAGATGSVAGQIARIKGASKVVGIAGGPQKCAWLVDELGFDAAIDYRDENVNARLKELFPKGVDLFFDNVGGSILDDALLNMAQFGRVVICGGIAAYNETELPPGPRNYMQIVIRRLTVRGFILIDHMQEADVAREQLAVWLAAGELRGREDIQEGFENTPATFLRLFRGENIGKQLLKVAEPPLPVVS